jgi:hypothetical protein
MRADAAGFVHHLTAADTTAELAAVHWDAVVSDVQEGLCGLSTYGSPRWLYLAWVAWSGRLRHTSLRLGELLTFLEAAEVRDPT